jgi:glycosyltransferase involved in cell wall biosynthesis
VLHLQAQAILLGAILKRFTRSKLILVLYGIEAWSKPDKPLMEWSLKQVDLVTAISRITRDRFSQWSGFPAENVTIISNGIELDKYGTGKRPVDLEQRYGLTEASVLITVGRLAAEEQAKGFDRVIQILPRLLKSVPKLRYLIVGSGSDQARLAAMAESLQVHQAVIFAGQVSENEKADHYRLADVFVMPSTGEGFGYVFLEAMACGIPVVGSSVDGGCDALLDGELGELVDPSDPDQITQAILKALEKPRMIPDKLKNFSVEQFRLRFQRLVATALR